MKIKIKSRPAASVFKKNGLRNKAIIFFSLTISIFSYDHDVFMHATIITYFFYIYIINFDNYLFWTKLLTDFRGTPLIPVYTKG